MPIFEYRGLTKSGQNTKGVVDSENLRAARLRLKKEGVFVTAIKDKKNATASANKRKKGQAQAGKTVPIRDLALMTRQLATLIKANIPLVDALTAIAEQVENPTLREAVADAKNAVNEGAPFYKSLAKYPRVFNNIYVSMCEAGEMSGTLDTILIRLAEFTEAQNEMRAKVKSALTYPVIMMVVTTAMLGFLFVFVIPKMVLVFEGFPDAKLPWYTEIVFSFSGLMVNYWYIFGGVPIVIYFLFFNWKSSAAGKRKWDAISLKLPVFGEVTRMVAVARFTRTLATLLTGGVPMLNAMQTVRNVVDNDIIAEAIDDARGNISEGESIAGPLKKSGQFPPIVIHMVNIGEKTGDLENMLIQVSDAYDFQVKNKLESMTSMMGPVVLVIMGFAIGVIVFSVMIPMFELTGNIG
jgi:general secretion pathway protein F